jgi:hypothetical protein
VSSPAIDLTAKFKRNSQPKLLGHIEEIVRRGRVRGIIP